MGTQYNKKKPYERKESRYTVRLDAQGDDELDYMQKALKCSPSEVFRRALHFIYQNWSEDPDDYLYNDHTIDY